MPTVRTMLAIAVAVVASDVLGNKIANALTGPETTATDKYINTAKVYGAKIGIGLASYVVMGMFGSKVAG